MKLLARIRSMKSVRPIVSLCLIGLVGWLGWTRTLPVPDDTQTIPVASATLESTVRDPKKADDAIPAQVEVTAKAAMEEVSPFVQEPSPSPPDPRQKALDEHDQRLHELEAVTQQLSQKLLDMETKVNQCALATQPVKQEALPVPASPMLSHRKLKRPKKKRPRRPFHHANANTATKTPAPPQNANWQEAEMVPPYAVEAVNRWGEVKRIVVKDPGAQRYQQLKIGDKLSNWTIEDAGSHGISLNNGRQRAILRIVDKASRHE